MSAPPAFALERWFASQQAEPGAIDLTGAGAPPLCLRDLLDLASSDERAAFVELSLGYGPGQGNPRLRSIVAARYRELDADAVLVTCGAIEGLHLAVAALVSAGDEVVVQDPMYPAVAGLVAQRGGRVIRWRLDPADGFRADPAALAPLLRPRTALVAITQPNGPTGSVLEAADLDAVIALLAARDIWLLSDEVYRELPLEPGLVVPAAVDRYERAISVADVAKPYGLGGLRIGWLAARDAAVRARIIALRDYTTLAPPAPSEALAAIALRHHDALTARPLANARANLARLAELAASDHLLSLAVPRAGTTAFVGVRDADSLQRRLRERGVLVVPGALFGHADRLRVGLAGSQDDFAASLSRLAALL